MKESKSAKLINGPVGRTITMLTLPMIIGMVGMLSFNLIDTYFVGQLGELELAAISFTFPITYIVTAISLGIGTGASAVVSRAIGREDRYWTVRYSSDSLMLGLITVAIFLIAGLFTIEPLFTALGAGPDTMPLIKDYMTIWYSGIIFVVIPMVGNSLLRATGDTKTPSFVMMFAVILNLILDPILIFGWWEIPAFGIKGAAWATVISRAFTLVLSLYFLYFRDKLLSFKKPSLEDAIKSWKDILYIGLPSAGTSLIMPIGVSIILSIISVYGPSAVAGFGVASRIEALSLTVIMALGSVLGPFIGQNLGAKKYDRVILSVRYTSIFSMFWGAFIMGIMFVFADNIAPVFNESEDVIDVIVQYLYYVPFTYGFQSIIILIIVSFNVLNKPFYAVTIGILRMLATYVPLAYLGSYLFGVYGIFYAASAANIISGTVGYFWLNSYLKKVCKP